MRPNILLIMADQLIPQLTGAYGNEELLTPHMNALAASGTRFDAAYSPCPVCVPARAAMMSGRAVSDIGCCDNATPLTCDHPTFAHFLSLGGYDTVLSGKMHFIGPDQLHGFSRRLTGDIYPPDFRWAEERDADNPVRKAHVEQYLGKNIRVGGWNQFLSYDEESHLRGCEFLRAQGELRRAGSEQPFLLCVSYHHPHEPFQPPRRYWDRYERRSISVPDLPRLPDEELYSTLDRWLNLYHGIDGRREELMDPESLYRLRRAYYALVSFIDDKVGELLSLLDETGLKKNTWVILTSDHGDMLGRRGMVQKRTFYDFSSRVPLILRAPDGRGAGDVRPEPASLVDIFPTLLDIAGIDPGEFGRLLDGRSLLEPPHEDRCVFSEYHSLGAYSPSFMLRRGRWKYIYVHGFCERLYDMERDREELENLAAIPEYSSVTAELRSALLERFDPAAIETRVSSSTRRRLIIRDAMLATGTRWEYSPVFDTSSGFLDQYLDGESISEIPR